MYLNLGQNTLIIKENIIGIFDLDNTTVSKKTRDWLKSRENQNKVFYTSYDLPKSFIIYKKNGEEIIYISQLSPSTLLKRIKSNSFIIE